MIIDRFGSTYAGAFDLTNLQADDNWPAARPPVISPVSGAGGAFDHYGVDNYPVSPLNISKTFTLSGSSYANVGVLETALRAAAISVGESKLWGIWRDGTTRVWAWAKCIGLSMPRTSDGQFTTMPGEIVFFAREGLWYGEVEHTGFHAFAASPFNFSDTNNGNYPALVKTTINANHTADALSNPSSGWTSTTAFTSALVVDARAYSVWRDTFIDAYATFSPDAGQVAWLWLAPGSNSMTYTYTGAGGQIQTEYFHTYVL